MCGESRKHGFGWEGWSSNAPLDPTNLRGFSPESVNRAALMFADLSGATLNGADLSKANLYGANLQGANLQGQICKELISRELF